MRFSAWTSLLNPFVHRGVKLFKTTIFNHILSHCGKKTCLQNGETGCHWPHSLTSSQHTSGNQVRPEAGSNLLYSLMGGTDKIDYRIRAK